jgi:hypothetical protein
MPVLETAMIEELVAVVRDEHDARGLPEAVFVRAMW